MNLRYFAKNICTSFAPQTRCLSTLPLSEYVNKALTDETKLLHSPVMVHKVIELLNPQPSKNILDMTFGAGGHTKEILRKCPKVNLFALDRDPLAHQLAKDLSEKNPQVKPLLGRFSEAKKLLKELYGVTSIQGAILDAGVSSMQFDDGHRGFSLSKDGPLDMRMDQDRDSDQPSARDVVNSMSETNLVQVIKKYGEERHAKIIARAVVDHRYAYGPIESTQELADIIASSIPGEAHRFDQLQRPTHLATKTFQAIRIFVNNELNELSAAMEAVYDLLVPGGVFIVLTFHSLEDRIVKRHFHGIALDEPKNRDIRSMSRKGKLLVREDLENYMVRKWDVMLKRVTLPTPEEVDSNPRARSAKLRFAYKPLTDEK